MMAEATAAALFPVAIADYRAEARDVVVLELRRPDGAPLPPFQPGAHIDVRLPNGELRQYSLANDCRERDRYVIGVLREAPGHGRGGSEFVHRMLAAGTTLQISPPRNNFPLEPDAAAYRFVAGGIGITPILSMLRWCNAERRPWRLVYAARSRCRAAFYEDLHELGGEQVTWHFDDEAGSHLDVARALAGLAEGELVYCCGPRPLMNSVREQLGTHAGVGRFESFLTPEARPAEATTAAAGGGDKTFTVRLRKSGTSFEVPVGKSILEVLEANGFNVPFSCRAGECGTCVTRVLEGRPDHRDYVLSNEERASNSMMCLCVSRALTPQLVLDL
jgi:ferredoxin-NADP reductase